jgi:cytochrome c-L
MRRSSAAFVATAFLSSALPLCAAGAEQIVFHNIVDNSPLDVTPKPGERETPAVKKFKRTGRNPYDGQARAIRDGRRLYAARCQGCHLSSGKGRIGASLITDQPDYPQMKTDVGLFEIIYGGATGAMQPFALQGLRQDSILKVMAYVRTLRRSASPADRQKPPE